MNGTTASAATTNTMWRNGLSDLTFSMDFTPLKGLIIRPGIELMKADVVSLTNGVVNPELRFARKRPSR